MVKVVKLSDTIVINESDDEVQILNIEDFSFYKINEMAKLILDKVQIGMNSREIVQAIKHEYLTSKTTEELLNIVETFITDLIGKKILIECSQNHYE